MPQQSKLVIIKDDIETRYSKDLLKAASLQWASSMDLSYI